MCALSPSTAAEVGVLVWIAACQTLAMSTGESRLPASGVPWLDCLSRPPHGAFDMSRTALTDFNTYHRH